MRGAVGRLKSTRLGRKLSMFNAGGSPNADGARARARMTNGDYIRLLRRIRRTTLIVWVASVLTMSLLAAFSVSEIARGYRDVCQPGRICYMALLEDAVSLGLLGILGALQVYIFDTVRGNQERGRALTRSRPARKTTKTEPSYSDL